MRYKFICEYNGAAFAGWQEQTKQSIKTVQSELERALNIVFRENIKVVGSGRTDAGVHSRGQCAHFDFDGEFGYKELERSLNALCGGDLCVRSLEQCDSEFHARYSAKERYYIYSIAQQPVVLGKELVWQCFYNLNAVKMAKEAEDFLGTHDFNAFSVPRNDGKSTECTINEFKLEENGYILRWHIKADRFLHKMVRSMVGLLSDVGRGRFENGAVKKVFNGEFIGERTWAPPNGLVLEKVFYLYS